MKTKDKISSTVKANIKDRYNNPDEYFKKIVDRYDSDYGSTTLDADGIDEKRKWKTNYDLFNNILDNKDLSYVCKPFGDGKDVQLQAKMANRDISSGKIKAMLGMEMDSPVSWSAVAVNPEATTRKEQEETSRLVNYVESFITTPIKQQIEQRKAQEIRGRQLTQDEINQVNEQVAQELAAQTPKEVKRYMQSDHQDPAETMSTHLLKYLMQKLDLKTKFNNAFKHGMLSAHSIMYVGILKNEPATWVVNPMRFKGERNNGKDTIEEGSWATCEYLMSPAELLEKFSFTDAEVEKIFEAWNNRMSGDFQEDLFESIEKNELYGADSNLISVLHATWKEPRKMGYLTYVDANGKLQKTTVNDDYKLNVENGDVDIEWEWFNEVCQGWKIKIGEPIYKELGPIPGQFKDIDNLHETKLPYKGIVYDNMNSVPTCVMDRLKVYQYYYNIIMFRIEMLIASDKGKKLLMNIGAVPKSANIDLKKWRYFFESSNFVWYDNTQEGMEFQDANTVAKVLDLSLVSDINKYIEAAEYLRKQAGVSTGITDQVEGQIGSYDAVQNTKQAIVQSSYILRPFFDLHNNFKRNVLQALIETAKVAYRDSDARKLTYTMDDLTLMTFQLDSELLDDSTIGIFLSNSSKAEEAKETIKQLTHAALQNQKVELSDVLAVIRQEGIVEAENTLKAAEAARQEAETLKQQKDHEYQMEQLRVAEENAEKAHEREKELIILKEEVRRETELTKTALLGMSYNPDADTDGDGTNDFLEVAKFGVEADIKRAEAGIKRDTLDHSKYVEKRKLDQMDRKLDIEAKKVALTNKKSNSK